MPSISALAETAALIGDPARAAMLMSLMDGRALTATELARAARITPPTASGHLSRLTQAGLLAMERQGRHRYHRLASAAVAQMLESMMSVVAGRSGARPRTVVTGPRQLALRHARTCFDHLAGVLAVKIADRMVARGHVEWGVDGGRVTEKGAAFLGDLGIHPVPNGNRRGPVFCRPCLDWSERRPHIAGQVGAALCSACLDRGWVRRIEGSRALTISPAGRMALDRAFGARLLD